MISPEGRQHFNDETPSARRSAPHRPTVGREAASPQPRTVPGAITSARSQLIAKQSFDGSWRPTPRRGPRQLAERLLSGTSENEDLVGELHAARSATGGWPAFPFGPDEPLTTLYACLALETSLAADQLEAAISGLVHNRSAVHFLATLAGGATSKHLSPVTRRLLANLAKRCRPLRRHISRVRKATPEARPTPTTLTSRVALTTARVVSALRAAGVPERHPAITDAAYWLTSRRASDISDSATLSATCLALMDALPGGDSATWTTNLFSHPFTANDADRAAVSVLVATTNSPDTLVVDIERSGTLLMAGKTAFDHLFDEERWPAPQRRTLWERARAACGFPIPQRTPPSAEAAGLALQVGTSLPVDPRTPAVREALRTIWSAQELDAAWPGETGVHYLSGTAEVIRGLRAIGLPSDDFRITRAANWLRSRQHESGGFGESPLSIVRPALRGAGLPSATQTAKVMLALLAIDDDSDALPRAADFLVETQDEGGTWTDTEFTSRDTVTGEFFSDPVEATALSLLALAEFQKRRNGH